MKQINGHVLTTPANSRANLILSTMLLMIPTLCPLILLSDLSKLSPRNVDPTVFTALGPYHIFNTPSKSRTIRSNTIAFHSSGNSTITQNIHTQTRLPNYSPMSFLVSLVPCVQIMKAQPNLLLAIHLSLLATDTMT